MNTKNHSNELVVRYESANEGHEGVSGEISARQEKRKLYTWFIGGLQRLNGFCKDFDEKLWTALFDYATIYTKYESILSTTYDSLSKARSKVKVTG